MSEAVASQPTAQEPIYDLADEIKLVLHLTRNWMLYGGFSFVVFCTVVGAVKGLFS